MSVRLVLAPGVGALLLAAFLALGSSAPRLAGSNDLRLFFSIPVPAGSTLCQGPELVPGDAGRLRVYAAAGTSERPPLAVQLRDNGQTVAEGRVGAGTGEGGFTIPLEPVGGSEVVDEVCLENRGDEPVSLGGQTIPAEQAALVDGQVTEGRLRLEYVRPGSESWLDLAPTILHRFGLGKADALGSWTLYLAGALVLLAWLAALRLVLRGGRM